MVYVRSFLLSGLTDVTRKGTGRRPHVCLFLINCVNLFNSSYRYEISDDNTLVVRDVKYSDEGRYMCLSNSPRLERNVSAALQIKGTLP